MKKGIINATIEAKFDGQIIHWLEANNKRARRRESIHKAQLDCKYESIKTCKENIEILQNIRDAHMGNRDIICSIIKINRSFGNAIPEELAEQAKLEKCHMNYYRDKIKDMTRTLKTWQGLK